MTVKRVAASYSTGIQQRIASGHFFDGTLPVGAVEVAAQNSIYKHPAGNTGGLFFWETNEAIICSQFNVSLFGTGDVRLYLVNLDPATAKTATPTTLPGEDILIEEQLAATFVALDEARFKIVLLPGQALKLVTTNSSAAQIAQAVASIERTFAR